jgi:glutathione S-transferase
MLTLYHSPASRSSAFVWLLEELHVEYEIAYCTIKRRNGTGAPDPRNPHPEKRVPALVHDQQLVTEQAAIALYLTDTFPDRALGFAANSPRRGEYLTWLAFFAGEADPIYNTRLLYAQHLDPMSQRDQDRVVHRVSNAVRTGPFLMGQDFTAADVLLSSPFEWDPELARGNALIKEWIARLNERPAALRAASKDPFP